MVIRITIVAVVLACCVAPATLQAQAESAAGENGKPEMLTIGSPAPPLDIEHWVQDGNGKFTAVTGFEDGKVYMVEFWATWCGPCVASMPHISKLQDEYAGQGLQIISVSDEDLETVEEFLEREVRGEDGKTYAELTSNYCLTTDPDGSVSDDYMKAAGQNGIPTAFIVGKSGQIEWIGHPVEIDGPLEQVINDQWNREEFAVQFRAEQELDLLMSRLGAKMQAGATDEVIAELGEAIEQFEDEAVIARLKGIRAQVIITTGAAGAADAMTEMTRMIGDNADGLNNMAWAVVELHQSGQKVDADLIAAAVATAEKAVSLEPEGGHIIDTLAHLAEMQGDLDRAIELTEKAIAASGEEFPEFEDYLRQLQKAKSGDSGDDD